MYKMIYPDRRTVSAEVIIGWAQDCILNGETDYCEFDECDIDAAIAILDDLGHCTFAIAR